MGTGLYNEQVVSRSKLPLEKGKKPDYVVAYDGVGLEMVTILCTGLEQYTIRY